MGIIVKSDTFTGQSAPQLTWLDADFDALFTLVNGELDNDNIATNAAIAQSKILNLVTDLASKLPLAGGQMSGPLVILMDTPYLRLGGTEGSGRDYRLAEFQGDLYFQENTGSAWVTRYVLKQGSAPNADDDLTNVNYVKNHGGSPAFVSEVNTAGNIGTSSATYVDTLTASITTVRSRRLQITALFQVAAPTSPTTTAEISLAIDGTEVEAGFLASVGPVAGVLSVPVSLFYITPVLTNAAHTISVRLRSNSGVAEAVTILANAAAPGIIQLLELVGA